MINSLINNAICIVYSYIQKEKARIDYFGKKTRQLRTLWTMQGESIRADKQKFENLVSGSIPFSVEAYEDIYNITNDEEINIEIKGVVKMTDLTVTLLDETMGQGLVGMISSPMFKENIAIVTVADPDSTDFIFACLGCGENGNAPV